MFQSWITTNPDKQPNNKWNSIDIKIQMVPQASTYITPMSYVLYYLLLYAFNYKLKKSFWNSFEFEKLIERHLRFSFDFLNPDADIYIKFVIVSCSFLSIRQLLTANCSSRSMYIFPHKLKLLLFAFIFFFYFLLNKIYYAPDWA